MDQTPQPWWEHHSALVVLTRWMETHGYTAKDIAYAVEKPWKFELLYQQALSTIGEQLTIGEATRES